MSNKNAHVLVGVTSIVEILSGAPEGVPQRQVQSELLEIVQDHCLSQAVNFQIGEDKTLDLLLTNSPSPVNRVNGMPVDWGHPIMILSTLNMGTRLNGSNKPHGRFTSINEQIRMVSETI